MPCAYESLLDVFLILAPYLRTLMQACWACQSLRPAAAALACLHPHHWTDPAFGCWRHCLLVVALND